MLEKKFRIIIPIISK